MPIPKFLSEESQRKDNTTRARSKRQETRIASDLGGRTTINSGATFGENDVRTDWCEVEAKTTKKSSYPLKVGEWQKLRTKCDVKKIPMMVITFESDEMDLAVLPYDDLVYLIGLANANK